tara:strand:+ start:1805 stop:2362 length:558 start_codon:yes stop_codon:yes gene_type:complete
MALTTGHNVVCCDRNRRGGLKTIWLANTDDITSFTADTTAGTHQYTTVTMAGSPASTFYKWEFDRGTAGFTASATRENGSTLIDVSLEFYIPKVTGEVNHDLMELVTSCGITSIVESYADDCESPAVTYKFVLGWDEIFEETAYMEFTTGEETTGVALQDANGTAITLTTQQGEYPREFIGTVPV